LVIFKEQKVISHSYRGKEVQDQGKFGCVIRASSSRGEELCPHVEEGTRPDTELRKFPFIRSFIPFTKEELSWLSHLLTPSY
jgi:hypothetical protein